MKYTHTDLQALKSPDIMRTYAEARLDGRTVGRVFKCACPWGLHNDPRKVEITEYHGEGRATCWACGKNSVKIFELAAACSGIPNDKDHFAELVEHVAAVTGYRLTDAAPAAHGKKSHRRPAAPKTPQNAAASPAEGTPRPWVDDGAESLAFQAVECAARNPGKVAALAVDLGLPAHALTVHTDMECHALGLIGLSPRGVLLFISTRWAEGRLRVTAIKSRAPMHGTAPAEVIEGGRWVVRGTLDASRRGGKFRICAKGAGLALWGEDGLMEHNLAIITEGESDKIAVDHSLNVYRTAHQTGLSDLSEYLPERVLPAVVSCAGAQVFKPAWARLFLGKAVIICGDADRAGNTGMERTAAILHQAGVNTVLLWTPRTGCKDARDQYRASRPAELVEDIISRAN